MKALLLLASLVGAASSLCHTFGALHEYCNITAVWSERYSDRNLFYLLLFPLAVPLITAAVSMIKLLCDAFHDLKALAKEKHQVDQRAKAAVSAVEQAGEAQLSDDLKDRADLPEHRPSLMRYVLGTLLKIYLVVSDAVSAVFDVYFLYQLERGALLTVYITRDTRVLDVMLGCTMFGAGKSILIAVIIFLSSKYKAFKNCDVLIAMLAYITQDAAQIILQQFWVEKYLVSSPSLAMQINNVVMLATALIMLLKHVISVVRRAAKRGYQRLRDEGILEDAEKPDLEKPDPEKSDAESSGAAVLSVSLAAVEPDAIPLEVLGAVDAVEPDMEPAALTDDLVPTEETSLLPPEQDKSEKSKSEKAIPKIEVSKPEVSKPEEVSPANPTLDDTALLKEVSEPDETPKSATKCAFFVLLCGIILEVGASLTIGLRAGSAFYILFYPDISSSCLYVDAATGLLRQDPFNSTCLTVTDYFLLFSNFLLPICLLVMVVALLCIGLFSLVGALVVFFLYRCCGSYESLVDWTAGRARDVVASYAA